MDTGQCPFCGPYSGLRAGPAQGVRPPPTSVNTCVKSYSDQVGSVLKRLLLSLPRDLGVGVGVGVGRRAARRGQPRWAEEEWPGPQLWISTSSQGRPQYPQGLTQGGGSQASDPSRWSQASHLSCGLGMESLLPKWHHPSGPRAACCLPFSLECHHRRHRHPAPSQSPGLWAALTQGASPRRSQQRSGLMPFLFLAPAPPFSCMEAPPALPAPSQAHCPAEQWFPRPWRQAPWFSAPSPHFCP